MVSEHDHRGFDFKVKNVAKAALIPVLVKAVQEQSAEIDALKNIIQEQSAALAILLEEHKK